MGNTAKRSSTAWLTPHSMSLGGFLMRIHLVFRVLGQLRLKVTSVSSIAQLAPAKLDLRWWESRFNFALVNVTLVTVRNPNRNRHDHTGNTTVTLYCNSYRQHIRTNPCHVRFCPSRDREKSLLIYSEISQMLFRQTLWLGGSLQTRFWTHLSTVRR